MEKIIDNISNAFSMKLSSHFHIEDTIMKEGTWESHTEATLGYFINPGDVCVDVGANNGFHSLVMAKNTGPSGQVFCFEPNSLTFPRLIDNVNLNEKHNWRLTCIKKGCWNQKSVLKIYQAGDTGNAYIGENYNESVWNRVGPEDFDLVIADKLDNLLSNTRIDFIKIDVEGNEIFVLQGAELTILRHHPIIIFETLLDCFDKELIKNSTQYLDSLGYLLYGIEVDTGKLKKVSYPDLCSDTIAIHKSRISNYKAILNQPEKVDTESHNIFDYR